MHTHLPRIKNNTSIATTIIDNSCSPSDATTAAQTKNCVQQSYSFNSFVGYEESIDMVI